HRKVIAMRKVVQDGSAGKRQVQIAHRKQQAGFQRLKMSKTTVTGGAHFRAPSAIQHALHATLASYRPRPPRQYDSIARCKISLGPARYAWPINSAQLHTE